MRDARAGSLLASATELWAAGFRVQTPTECRREKNNTPDNVGRRLRQVQDEEEVVVKGRAGYFFCVQRAWRTWLLSMNWFEQLQCSIGPIICRRNFPSVSALSSMRSENEFDAAKARARALFREQQKAEAPKAVSEYYAAEKAVRDRTRKLREERLAREAKSRR